MSNFIDNDDDVFHSTIKTESKPVVKSTKTPVVNNVDDDDGDDAMAYFRKLASED